MSEEKSTWKSAALYCGIGVAFTAVLAGMLLPNLNYMRQQQQAKLELVPKIAISENSIPLNVWSWLTLRLVGSKEEPLDQFDITIEGMQFKTENVTNGDLSNGVQIGLLPSKTGTFPLKISRNGRVVDEVYITVYDPRDQKEDGPVAYRLERGKGISHGGGGKTVPFFVVAVNKDGNPVPSLKTIEFQLVDRAATPPTTLGLMVLANGKSMSLQQELSFGPQTNMRLQGSTKDETVYTNQVQLSWRIQGPTPKLSVKPDEQATYATGGTGASIVLSLIDEDGLSYQAIDDMRVVAETSHKVEVSPAELNIKAGTRDITCKVTSTTGGDAEIKFELIGTNTPVVAAKVKFLNIFWFWVIAIISGIVVRCLWLTDKSNWPVVAGKGWKKRLILLVVILGPCAVGVVFVSVIFLYLGGIEGLKLSSQTLNYVVAGVVGAVGGVLGFGALSVAFPSFGK